MNQIGDDFVADLHDVVGATRVLLADQGDDLVGFITDWTGRFVGHSDVVVQPANHDEVVAVVALCRRHGRTIVPQGGNTGLVGGSIPLHGEVVVSTTRLAELGPVDPVNRHVVAGAGVTLAAVQQAAATAGLRYPVDFGARDSATVGGMIATNAGGIGVLRFGSTRRHVRGLTAVLGDGTTVHHMAGLIKDNTGYDLTGLMCGSEGTLGIVTSALLQLVPAARVTSTVLIGCLDMTAAVDLVVAVTIEFEDIEAAEFMTETGMALVEDVTGLRCPVRAAVYVLIDVACGGDRAERVLRVISDQRGVTDTAVAEDQQARSRLWRFREEHTLAIASLGPPLKFDVTVPLSRLSAFLTRVSSVVADGFPGARVFFFGHLGDGNVHVNVCHVPQEREEAMENLVLGLVSEYGGSISAEHGIGTMKKNYLHLSRSPGDVATMRRIKKALDPDNIMNPQVLLPDE